MTLVFSLVLMVMELLVIIFHNLGLYLLRCLHRDGKGTPQQTYIMNLSAVEIFINIFYFLVNLLLVLMQFKVTGIDYLQVFTYLELAGANTGLIFIYYMTMFYILLDKVLEVFWNIKYPVYWTIAKAKYLVFGTGIVGLLMAIGFVIAYYYNNKLEYKMPLTYFYVSFNFAFLVVAIASYMYVFYKYRQSRISPTHYASKSTPEESLWNTFRNSRFYLSTFLIVTFVVLVLIPDLIVFFMLKHIDNYSSRIMARKICPILFHISYMSDAGIYIFMHPPVKALLIKKLRNIKCWSKCLTNTSSSIHTVDRAVDRTTDANV